MNDQSSGPSGGTGDLQFDRADAPIAASAGSACVICKQPLSGTYFEVNGKTVCPVCRDRLNAELNKYSPGVRFVRALGLGAGGAILGAGVYLAAVLFAHLEWSLISIAVGYLVGKGVRKGSGGHGGRLYQAMAVTLTYLAFIATYAVVAVQIEGNAGVLTVLGSPIIVGIRDPLTLLIIAIGIYFSWSLNRRPAFAITGPYRVAAPSAGPA